MFAQVTILVGCCDGVRGSRCLMCLRKCCAAVPPAVRCVGLTGRGWLDLHVHTFVFRECVIVSNMYAIRMSYAYRRMILGASLLTRKHGSAGRLNGDFCSRFLLPSASELPRRGERALSLVFGEHVQVPVRRRSYNVLHCLRQHVVDHARVNMLLRPPDTVQCKHMQAPLQFHARFE